MFKKVAISFVGGILVLAGGAIAIPTAVASATTPTTYSQVVYDSTTSPLPGNLVSEAFEATQTSEFGNEITFAPGTSRTLSQATVTLSSWGCQSGSWTGGCVTTPGSTFSEPVTLNLYAVGPNNTVGALLSTVTQTFNIPYRPSASPAQCPSTPTEWWDATDGSCYNGLATNITFTLPGVTVPDSVIYGIAYNTSDYGYAPYGDNTACHATSGGCGYDSLNVGLTIANGPSVGTDPVPGTIFQNTSYGPFYCDNCAAGVGTFRLDSPDAPLCWGNNTDAEGNYDEAPWYIPAVQFVAQQVVSSQTITITSPAPTSAYVGGPLYTLSATASSGLPVSFASTTSSVCSVSGSTVSFVGQGTCTVVASQAGSAQFAAAQSVSQSFSVAGAPQSITYTSTAPTNAYIGGPTYTVSAKATSGLPVIFGSASPNCTISNGDVVSFVAPGYCNIVAFQLGNATYASAPPLVQTFTVNLKPQTITITSTPPTNAYTGGPTYTLSATASSGLPVTWASANPAVCTVSGTTVSFVGNGICNVVAFQFGNSLYASATPLVQTFGVFPQVAPAFTSASSGSATWLQSFSTTISADGIPMPSVKVVSGLPLGVTAKVGASSVTLSGTPLLFGSFPITLAATSSAGTTYFTYTLNVKI